MRTYWKRCATSSQSTSFQNALTQSPFDVLVLQVVGVLPHVEDQQRHRAVADVALVIVDLFDDQALADRLPRTAPQPEP